jgi:allophanate hydrolase subunit 2
LLGQIKPGDEVQFAAISLEEAHRALDETGHKVNNLSALLNS